MEDGNTDSTESGSGTQQSKVRRRSVIVANRPPAAASVTASRFRQTVTASPPSESPLLASTPTSRLHPSLLDPISVGGFLASAGRLARIHRESRHRYGYGAASSLVGGVAGHRDRNDEDEADDASMTDEKTRRAAGSASGMQTRHGDASESPFKLRSRMGGVLTESFYSLLRATEREMDVMPSEQKPDWKSSSGPELINKSGAFTRAFENRIRMEELKTREARERRDGGRSRSRSKSKMGSRPFSASPLRGRHAAGSGASAAARARLAELLREEDNDEVEVMGQSMLRPSSSRDDEDIGENDNGGGRHHRLVLKDVTLPATITYSHGQVQSWYFSSKIDHSIKRKHSRNLTVERIVQEMLSLNPPSAASASSSSQGNDDDFTYRNSLTVGNLAFRTPWQTQREVAVVAAFYPSAPPRPGSPCSATFFDAQQLVQFVREGARRARVSGVLQKFVPSAGVQNSMLRVTWTPSICLVERRSSTYKLDSNRIRLAERIQTYEVPMGLGVEVREELVHDTSRLRYVLDERCRAIAKHLTIVSGRSVAMRQSRIHHARFPCSPSKLTIYFKLSNRNQLYLLLCDEVRWSTPPEVLMEEEGTAGKVRLGAVISSHTSASSAHNHNGSGSGNGSSMKTRQMSRRTSIIVTAPPSSRQALTNGSKASTRPTSSLRHTSHAGQHRPQTASTVSFAEGHSSRTPSSSSQIASDNNSQDPSSYPFPLTPNVPPEDMHCAHCDVRLSQLHHNPEGEVQDDAAPDTEAEAEAETGIANTSSPHPSSARTLSLDLRSLLIFNLSTRLHLLPSDESKPITDTAADVEKRRADMLWDLVRHILIPAHVKDEQMFMQVLEFQLQLEQNQTANTVDHPEALNNGDTQPTTSSGPSPSPPPATLWSSPIFICSSCHDSAASIACDHARCTDIAAKLDELVRAYIQDRAIGKVQMNGNDNANFALGHPSADTLDVAHPTQSHEKHTESQPPSSSLLPPNRLAPSSGPKGFMRSPNPNIDIGGEHDKSRELRRPSSSPNILSSSGAGTYANQSATSRWGSEWDPYGEYEFDDYESDTSSPSRLHSPSRLPLDPDPLIPSPADVAALLAAEADVPMGPSLFERLTNRPLGTSDAFGRPILPSNKSARERARRARLESKKERDERRRKAEVMEKERKYLESGGWAPEWNKDEYQHIRSKLKRLNGSGDGEQDGAESNTNNDLANLNPYDADDPYEVILARLAAVDPGRAEVLRRKRSQKPVTSEGTREESKQEASRTASPGRKKNPKREYNPFAPFEPDAEALVEMERARADVALEIWWARRQQQEMLAHIAHVEKERSKARSPQRSASEVGVMNQASPDEDLLPEAQLSSSSSSISCPPLPNQRRHTMDEADDASRRTDATGSSPYGIPTKYVSRTAIMSDGQSRRSSSGARMHMHSPQLSNPFLHTSPLPRTTSSSPARTPQRPSTAAAMSSGNNSMTPPLNLPNRHQFASGMMKVDDLLDSTSMAAPNTNATAPSRPCTASPARASSSSLPLPRFAMPTLSSAAQATPPPPPLPTYDDQVRSYIAENGYPNAGMFALNMSPYQRKNGRRRSNQHSESDASSITSHLNGQADSIHAESRRHEPMNASDSLPSIPAVHKNTESKKPVGSTQHPPARPKPAPTADKLPSASSTSPSQSPSSSTSAKPSVTFTPPIQQHQQQRSHRREAESITVQRPRTRAHTYARKMLWTGAIDDSPLFDDGVGLTPRSQARMQQMMKEASAPPTTATQEDDVVTRAEAWLFG